MECVLREEEKGVMEEPARVEDDAIDKQRSFSPGSMVGFAWDIYRLQV